MSRRYYGIRRWHYRFTRGKPASAELSAGTVELQCPGEGYRNDELMARYLLRKKLGLKRLPAGTQFWPHNWID